MEFELEEVYELVDRHKPELRDDPEFQEWIAVLSRIPRERKPEKWEKWHAAFKQWLNARLEKEFRHPLYAELPEGMTFPSGIELGTSFGRPVYLPAIWLASNMMIAGQSNAGKTNAMLTLIDQFAEHGVNTWIIDFQREYGRKLEGRNFVEIPLQRLRINPLNLFEPSDAMKNLTAFQRIFGHSQGLWDASQGFIGPILKWLYGAFGAFEPEAAKRRFPNMLQLWEAIEKASVSGHREREYKMTTLNRFKDLLTLHGEIFDCQKGFDVETLVNSNLIFDLRGLKPQTASFMSECLMAQLYEYWAARGEQDRLRNVIVSDEAKHVFNVRLQRRLPDVQPYVDNILAETRKFGIGLILADQQPSELTPSVSANSYVKAVMQLGGGEDLNRMVQEAGLQERQQPHLYRLQQGEAILKVSGHSPFKISFPLYQP